MNNYQKIGGINMKSKFRPSALFGVLLIALSGCDIFTGVDSFPVSAVIDDVTYVSIPGVNYFQRSHDHTLMLERDYFSFSLQRELANTELGQRNIQIQVTEAFDGRVELNKKYNVSGLTRLFTPIDVGFYEHDAISGWVMFTEMTPSSLTDQSGTVYISGEFEIVFEGVNDGDVILAKDGYWGPSLFNYYYGYDKDVL